MKGFILRIQPSGYKCYYVAYSKPNGQRARHKIGPADRLSVEQARRMVKEFLGAVSLGDDPAEAKRLTKAKDLETFLTLAYGPWGIANRKSGQATP